MSHRPHCSRAPTLTTPHPAAMTVATAAGAVRPLLITPTSAKGPFPRGREAATLGCLSKIYVPLEARELDEPVEVMLGVRCDTEQEAQRLETF